MLDWVLLLGGSTGHGAATAKRLAKEGYGIIAFHFDRGDAKKIARDNPGVDVRIDKFYSGPPVFARVFWLRIWCAYSGSLSRCHARRSRICHNFQQPFVR